MNGRPFPKPSIHHHTFPHSNTNHSIGSCKPRGLHAARKLRTDRRDNRWADKTYRKSALGTVWKSSPFGGSSHSKGIVLEKMYVLFVCVIVF